MGDLIDFASQAIKPFTTLPAEQQQAAQESADYARNAALDFSSRGIVGKAVDVGKMALGGLGYVTSPVTALGRAFVSKPVEEATGVPHQYTDMALSLLPLGSKIPAVNAALDTGKELVAGGKVPALGLTRLPGDRPRETIASSALNVDGRIFTGPSHADAVGYAIEKGGVDARAIDEKIKANDFGYLTSEGRYVSEEEAAKIAGVDRKDITFPAKQSAAEVGRAGNINLSKITGPDEIHNLLTETAQTSPEVQGAGRGVISLGEQEQLARETGMTVDDLLKRTKGEAFNAERAVAARNLLTTSAQDVFRRAKAAQGGSDADVAAFMESLTRHRAIQEQVSGLTAEAGRALGSFRIPAGFDEAKALKKIIGDAGGRQNAEDIAAAVQNLDPDKLGTFTANVFRPTWKDKARTLWLNLVLSNPTTHAANTTSNFLTLFASQIPEAVGSGIINAVTGGKGDTLTQAGARLYGYVSGMRAGFANAGKTIATGVAPSEGSKLELARFQPFGQGAGRILTGPTTAMSAEDELFKGMATTGEMYSQAAGMAQKEGLSILKDPAAFRQRVVDLASNPTPDMLDAAAKHAEYVTFQSPLGKIGQASMNLRKEIPGGWFVMPFVRTPANIFKYAAERTPAGLAMSDVRDNLMGKNGIAARNTQMSRMALGTGAATALASWAAEGRITGAGPTDPNMAALYREQGIPPYSIKFGDKWYSYRRLDPFASVIGPVADLVELGKASEGPDADKIGGMIVTALSNNLVNKTYLSGISDFFAALNDKSGTMGDRWIQSMAGSLVPAGVAGAARIEDPVLRDARGIVDTLRSRIPFASEDLAPRRTRVFGDVIKRDEALGPDWLSPVTVSPQKNDPVIGEMIRLGVTPGPPQRKIRGEDLTPQQFSEYQRLAGERTRERLTPIVTGLTWPTLSDAEKEKAIQKEIVAARNFARNAVLPKPKKGEVVAPPDQPFGNSMFGGQ